MKIAEGVVLGRPKGRKSGYVKLTGKAHDIKVLLDYGIPKIQIAKKMGVNRNTLAAYLNTRYEAELDDDGK